MLITVDLLSLPLLNNRRHFDSRSKLIACYCYRCPAVQLKASWFQSWTVSTGSSTARTEIRCASSQYRFRQTSIKRSQFAKVLMQKFRKSWRARIKEPLKGERYLTAYVALFNTMTPFKARSDGLRKHWNRLFCLACVKDIELENSLSYCAGLNVALFNTMTPFNARSDGLRKHSGIGCFD